MEPPLSSFPFLPLTPPSALSNHHLLIGFIIFFLSIFIINEKLYICKVGGEFIFFFFFLSLVFFLVVEDVPFKLMIPDFSTLHQKDLKCWHFFFAQ